MAGPFPGMDPYLEGCLIWPDVQHRLIGAAGDALVLQVAPAYYVRIAERTFIAEVDRRELAGRPEVAVVQATPETAPYGGTAVSTAIVPQVVTLPQYEEIRESYLEIYDTQSRDVVTVVAILSAANKSAGEGRRRYEVQRQRVLRSEMSLAEIDLLRAGEPMEMEPTPVADYRILVRAGWERPRASLYAFSLRQAIPEMPVPLRRSEATAVLALGPLLAEVYERARYDLSFDYRESPPEPSLSPDDASWLDQCLRAQELR
jgi:hypothetical protein